MPTAAQSIHLLVGKGARGVVFQMAANRGDLLLQQLYASSDHIRAIEGNRDALCRRLLRGGSGAGSLKGCRC